MVSTKRVGIAVLGLVIGYLILIQLIYFAAPDQPATQFPDNCTLTSNCTRVAESNVRGQGLEPLRYNTTLVWVHQEVTRFITEQSRTKILTDEPQFIHAVFITPGLRFHDDFYVQLICEAHQVIVFVHSESRLGQGDLNVNEERVDNFYQFMEGQTVEEGTC